MLVLHLYKLMGIGNSVLLWMGLLYETSALWGSSIF